MTCVLVTVVAVLALLVSSQSSVYHQPRNVSVMVIPPRPPPVSALLDCFERGQAICPSTTAARAAAAALLAVEKLIARCFVPNRAMLAALVTVLVVVCAPEGALYLTMTLFATSVSDALTDFRPMRTSTSLRKPSHTTTPSGDVTTADAIRRLSQSIASSFAVAVNTQRIES